MSWKVFLFVASVLAVLSLVLYAEHPRESQVEDLPPYPPPPPPICRGC
jgi:hypothetical protein